MKIADRHARGLLLIIGTAMLLAGCSDEPRAECGEILPFAGPSDDEFLLLAEAIGGRVQVSHPSEPSFAGNPSEVTAYRFVVDQVANATVFSPGPPPVIDHGSSPLSQSDTFLVVPWLHTESCQLVAWNREDWISDDTAVVFRISEGRFHRGTHVFDVLAAYSPYPAALSLADLESSSASGDREDWMSAQEYFEMMRQLPTMDSTRTRTEQLRALDSKFRTSPTWWVDKFPGMEIVRRAREWAVPEGGVSATP